MLWDDSNYLLTMNAQVKIELRAKTPDYQHLHIAQCYSIMSSSPTRTYCRNYGAAWRENDWCRILRMLTFLEFDKYEKAAVKLGLMSAVISAKIQLILNSICIYLLHRFKWRVIPLWSLTKRPKNSVKSYDGVHINDGQWCHPLVWKIRKNEQTSARKIFHG